MQLGIEQRLYSRLVHERILLQAPIIHYVAFETDCVLVSGSSSSSTYCMFRMAVIVVVKFSVEKHVK